MFYRFFLTLVFLSSSAFARDLNCPPAIEVTKQSLKQRIQGWQPFYEQNTIYNLDGIDLYDGKPEEMAALKPDNQDSEDSFSEWQLYNNSERYYFIVCRYKNTSVQLTRQVPLEAKKCRVDYEQNSNGTPTYSKPKKVMCE